MARGAVASAVARFCPGALTRRLRKEKFYNPRGRHLRSAALVTFPLPRLSAGGNLPGDFRGTQQVPESANRCRTLPPTSINALTWLAIPTRQRPGECTLLLAL